MKLVPGGYIRGEDWPELRQQLRFLDKWVSRMGVYVTEVCDDGFVYSSLLLDMRRRYDLGLYIVPIPIHSAASFAFSKLTPLSKYPVYVIQEEPW